MFLHHLNIYLYLCSYIHFYISAQFLLEHGHHDTDSIMRGKAAVAFHNGNFKELYSIMEGRWVSSISICLISLQTIFCRSFDPQYHAELQDMWYKAHYKEAEKIRARPLGEYFPSTKCQVVR